MTKIISDDGLYIQYRNDEGKLHNINGPAVINDSNKWLLGPIREHWVNGSLHRLDGPAYEVLNHPQFNEWYFNGKYIKCSSQEEFDRFFKLKAFW